MNGIAFGLQQVLFGSMCLHGHTPLVATTEADEGWRSPCLLSNLSKGTPRLPDIFDRTLA
jgi:hypothetical protein